MYLSAIVCNPSSPYLSDEQSSTVASKFSIGVLYVSSGGGLHPEIS